MHIHGLPQTTPPSAPTRGHQKAIRPEAGTHGTLKPNVWSDGGDRNTADTTAIDRLAAKLEGTPEVRAELVAQAFQRMQSGYYLTQDAAEQTADKLIG